MNQEANEIIPPLGLGYLASSIRNIASVEIWDEILLHQSFNSFEKRIRLSNAKYYGIQCYSTELYSVIKYASIIRKYHPESFILIGGPHPSCFPLHTLTKIKDVDFGFIGESEVSFPILVNLLKDIPRSKLNFIPKLSQIPGLIYRINEKVFTNPNKLPENLDDFSPSYNLLHLEKYPVAPHGGYCKRYPTAPIIITRGCPNLCQFCGGKSISGKIIRHHSIPFIINQLKILKFKYGIKEFHIEDDNFTANRSFAIQFCQALLDSQLDLTWTAANGIRLDTIDEELLDLMIKSGLYSISVGIESSSESIRNLMKKNLPNKILFQKLQLLKSRNIDLIGFFILGYPGETEAQIEQTIDFACKIGLKRANFATFKPLPGAPIFHELIKSNQLKKLDWRKLNLHSIAWASDTIGIRKLDYLRRKALWKFYIRPTILFDIFKSAKNIYNLKMILLRIFRLLIRINK